MDTTVLIWFLVGAGAVFAVLVVLWLLRSAAADDERFRRELGRSPGSSGSQEKEGVFQIPWSSETGIGDRGLRDAYVLVSDIEGLTASDIAPIGEQCKQAGRPMVLVTPGVDRSIFPLLGEGDVMAIKASELPDQPVRGLLEDVAVITGGMVLRKELGFSPSFPDLPPDISTRGICIPGDAWDGLTLRDLGRVQRLLINRDGTEFHGPGPPRHVALAYTTQLLREEPTPGRDERLRRLCTAAGCLPDKAKAMATHPTDFSAEYRLGLASRYFITVPNTLECRLDDACVAIFGEPLDDLELLVRLLDRTAAAGRPMLIVAPSVSDEALAICVVNKLRGIVQCAVAIPRTPSPETAGLLADIARRTGARVVAGADSDRLQDEGSLGRATTVRATCDGMALTS